MKQPIVPIASCRDRKALVLRMKTQSKRPEPQQRNRRIAQTKTYGVKQRPKWVTPVVGAGSFLLLCGLGFYVFYFFASKPQDLDPKAALPMLDKLRYSPSTQEGLNVEALLTQELEKSRRVGNLLSYQGWTIKPINGSKTKLIISFSFEENDKKQQRAEWIADLVHNTFVPQTELAAMVYKK
jgi:hypothetical protein